MTRPGPREGVLDEGSHPRPQQPSTVERAPILVLMEPRYAPQRGGPEWAVVDGWYCSAVRGRSWSHVYCASFPYSRWSPKRPWEQVRAAWEADGVTWEEVTDE